MKPKSRKRSPTIGEFINRVYDVYFPYDLGHHGGTDADHLPVIHGNNFHTEIGHGDESILNPAAPSHEDEVSEHGLCPES